MNLIITQIRVIVALVLRETRMTFGSSHMGYLWAIIQPLVSISFMVFLFFIAGRQSPYGASLALFFSTAILTLELYNKTSVSLMRAFTSNKALLTYPMIKETDTLFARWVLIACTFVIINTIFYGGLIGLGLAQLPAHPDKLILAFLSTCFLGFGIGTINAIMYQRNQVWQHIEKILGRPLFFLSGVFYIPSNLPPQAIAVIKWNPILHLVEWTREGYYPNYESDVLNIGYPLSVATIAVLLGLFWERMTRKQRA
ncbi:ABC transporter [Pseudorhodobacter turbinis]|uniref:ABC transporter n=1 Tax=Pseudorhodobacter turbinis TaxID=2500533 RepID=A0A4P8EGG6_9RHOB|nr:ABC transporter permease [Pseudorhodobacter turbinis]QCO55822.1 ABC transporter [Pseudorhodobacter turbinis]